MSKITIIGAGNGGITAAYHFSKMGHEVCVYSPEEHAEQIYAIREKGGIKALDEIHDVEMLLNGFEKIKLATTSAKEAVEFSDYLIMIVPSFAQTNMFKHILPHLTDKHILMTMPGNFGSLEMKKMQNELGYENLDLTYVDAISIPWACRIFEPAEIGIMGLKELIYAGVLPSKRTNSIIEEIDKLFPIPVKSLKNVIEAGFENINFGGHPLITTINIGLLENFDGNFNYYRDCVSKATSKASIKMENERLEIGKGLGFNLIPELEMMNKLYNENAKTVYEFNRNSVAHVKIEKGPDSSKSRYITEDVAYLLVPIYEFAQLLEIEPPIMKSCITLASAYNDVDYFKEARTFEKMGLKDMTKKEILGFVK